MWAVWNMITQNSVYLHCALTQRWLKALQDVSEQADCGGRAEQPEHVQHVKSLPPTNAHHTLYRTHSSHKLSYFVLLKLKHWQRSQVHKPRAEVFLANYASTTPVSGVMQDRRKTHEDKSWASAVPTIICEQLWGENLHAVTNLMWSQREATEMLNME